MGGAFWSSPFGLVLACFGSGQPPFGGLSFINSAATLGGFVGPLGWLKALSGSCIVGLSAVAAIMLARQRRRCR
jgi:hypothetical protein